MLKSKQIKRIVMGGLLSLFVFAMPIFAAEKPPVKEETKQEQLNKKSSELKQIENNISLIEAECKKISSQQVYELAQRDAQQKKDDYLKAKDAYDRASKNADILPQEQLIQFLSNYKNADKALKISEVRLQEIKIEKERIENSLNVARKEKKAKEMEILIIKAELYETELSKAVWVEGVGECIMDENKTMKDCEKLALEYARRDAVEKGGKSLLESVTEVKMFELTKDDIKKTSKVNIIEQDNSGEFGKVKRIISGDSFKFMVTVRLKLQNVATYNPYQEKIKELQGEGKQVLPSSEKDKIVVKTAVSQTIHTIGEHYGGGIVFWVDPSGENGLIAATEDQSTGIQWYNGKYMETGAINDGVYAGKTNTKLIISKQGKGSYAAQICASYRGGGYNDWYLPSKYELNLLYNQGSVVGGFTYDYYWSSTEYSSNNAWFQIFSSGYQDGYNKYSTADYFSDGRVDLDLCGYQDSYNKYCTSYVRAVRAFYNPYQEKIKGLQGEEKQVSPLSEKDKIVVGIEEETTTECSEGEYAALEKLVGREEETTTVCSSIYTIGDHYGGGIVFWVDPSGEHGLIAATEDQSTGIQWYNGKNMEIGATNDGVYAGKRNTKLIISKQGKGSYAAQICASYRGGGYDDWYLPSSYELNLLYQQRIVVGGFADSYYWSSTDTVRSTNAWVHDFDNGSQDDYGSDKSCALRVRAVRAF